MHDNNNVNDDFVMIISQPQFMHHSITLNDWNRSAHASSQRSIVSINHNNTIKDVSKTTLKHLLLSLPHIGVTRSGKDVNGTWKHLCTTCICALRQEVEGERMLVVIKNSMAFLDIK